MDNSTIIGIDYEEAAQYAAKLTDYVGDMETILNRIKASLGKIGDEDVWRGSSADTVEATFNQMSEKFSNFTQLITDCVTYVNKTAENYRAAEAKISGSGQNN